MKQTRGNIPVLHICSEVYTEDLGEPWRWFIISSEVLALKIDSAVSIQGPGCALSNLVLLSHCFCSVLGYSAAWMGQRRALGSSGQHLLPSPVGRLLRA